MGLRKKRKITLLLGAGFACHMKGLGTSDIDELYSSDRQYTVQKDGKTLTLYDYFKSVLCHCYFDFSFETFLAALEQILDYRQGLELEGRNSTQDRSISSVVFTVNEELKDVELLSSSENVWSVYMHYIKLLMAAVDKYDNYHNCRSEATVFKDFISILRKSFGRVKIYSTNYDTLCLQLLKSDGIYASTSAAYGNESYAIYDLEGFRDSKLTYFPLHGCTHYRREVLNKIKFSMVSQDLSPALAIDNSAGNPNESTFFTPIVSGYNKLQHISGKPFIFGIQAFANDLQDSDVIISMGYSYRDPHINSYLATFPKTRIISINKDKILNLPIDLEINQQVMNISDFIDKLTLISLINSIHYE